MGYLAIPFPQVHFEHPHVGHMLVCDIISPVQGSITCSSITVYLVRAQRAGSAEEGEDTCTSI